jgi:hypothetical protein
MIASKVDTVGLSGAAVLPAEGTDIGGMYHVLRLNMIYRTTTLSQSADSEDKRGHTDSFQRTNIS